MNTVTSPHPTPPHHTHPHPRPHHTPPHPTPTPTPHIPTHPHPLQIVVLVAGCAQHTHTHTQHTHTHSYSFKYTVYKYWISREFRAFWCWKSRSLNHAYPLDFSETTLNEVVKCIPCTLIDIFYGVCSLHEKITIRYRNTADDQSNMSFQNNRKH